MSAENIKKIALFGNVAADHVFAAPDVDSVYSLPLLYHRQKLDKAVCDILRLSPQLAEAELSAWREFEEKTGSRQARTKVGLVGKYGDLMDSYKSLTEALSHAGIHLGAHVDVSHIDADTDGGRLPELLSACDSHFDSGRVWRARHGGKNCRRPLCARKRKAVFGNMHWNAGGDY